MEEQRNLTEDIVAELKKQLDRMSLDNLDLEYRFYEQEHTEKLRDDVECEANPYSNKAIIEKLESLERRIDSIFDGHVLINGSFVKITA